MKPTDKLPLFKRGIIAIGDFCKVNNIPPPRVTLVDYTRGYVCAFYNCNLKDPRIVISVNKCANTSFAESGRAWSFPGHMIDRTPFGALCHELGHHVGLLLSDQPTRWEKLVRKASGEYPITGYCPTTYEWFAEMFRLFVTNPDLLRLVRPKTYNALVEKCKPVEIRSWHDVLSDAPNRVKQILNERTRCSIAI